MWSRPACVVPFCLLCYLLEQLRPTVPRRPAEPELGCRCRLSPLRRVVDWYPSLPPEASVCASSTVNQTVEQCEAFRSFTIQSSLRLLLAAAPRCLVASLVASLPFRPFLFFLDFSLMSDRRRSRLSEDTRWSKQNPQQRGRPSYVEEKNNFGVDAAAKPHRCILACK